VAISVYNVAEKLDQQPCSLQVLIVSCCLGTLQPFDLQFHGCLLFDGWIFTKEKFETSNTGGHKGKHVRASSQR
jgi:hypothetical protein